MPASTARRGFVRAADSTTARMSPRGLGDLTGAEAAFRRGLAAAPARGTLHCSLGIHLTKQRKLLEVSQIIRKEPRPASDARARMGRADRHLGTTPVPLARDRRPRSIAHVTARAPASRLLRRTTGAAPHGGSVPGGRSCSTSTRLRVTTSLWRRFLGRPASECGRLRQGPPQATAGRPPLERATRNFTAHVLVALPFDGVSD